MDAADSSSIRLLVLDLDGTSVGVSNQFRPAVKQAVQAARDRGVQVAIATGRMFQSALRFYNDLELTLPLMTYQGALIREPASGRVHRHLRVPQSYARKLLDFFEQPELRSHISIHLYVDDQLYVRETTTDTISYAERSTVQPIAVGDLRQVLTREPTKILALSPKTDLIDQLLLTLRQQYHTSELYLTKSVATFLEATHPLVNKGTAVRYLAEEVLGLQAQHVMAIGDNFNDLEMIQYAGIGVAMDNAPDGVKQVAQWIAPSVEEDGVAVAIKQFLL